MPEVPSFSPVPSHSPPASLSDEVIPRPTWMLVGTHTLWDMLEAGYRKINSTGCLESFCE
jgi:hypothetical protein